MILSGVFLMVIASWMNEKAIPVPAGAWLAYDYRFSSTSYAIALAIAGNVFIRLLPVVDRQAALPGAFCSPAVLSVSASVCTPGSGPKSL